LLGIAAAQRGAIDRGNPEVLAAQSGVRAVLGPEAADQLMRRGRELPRADGLVVLSEVTTRPAELRGLPAVLPGRPEARLEVDARRP
jgi:hypothetical protein